MKTTGSITISRVSTTNKEDYISIRVEDELSGARFLGIELPLGDFSLCVTGRSGVPCKMELRELQNVGKKKESKELIFEMPECCYDDRIASARTEALRHTPEGWTANTYYGSQDSFFAKDGKQWARTTIVRWDREPIEQELIFDRPESCCRTTTVRRV